MILFGKTKLELKVGIFVFFGLIILIIFIMSIGKIETLTSGYEVNFTYSFINGVKTGAPVRFAGMDVGEVKKIKLFFVPEEQKFKVCLICRINKRNVKIPVDSTIWINTLGLLGEKYVEVMPGKDCSNFLMPKQTLAGMDPVPMHEVFHMAKNLVESLNQGLNSKEGTVGKFLHDPAVYNNIESLTDNLKKNPWKLFWKTAEKK